MTIWLVLPLAGCAIISAVGGHDVWNARYLAVVWPALVVLVSMTILRLPAPWLRTTAIALLIGANLLQYGLRVSVESGIPVDQISRDLATAKASSGRIRAVVAAREDPRDNGIGGGGGIFDFPGRYYMAMDQHLTLRPHQLRDQSIRKHVAIAGDVGNLPPTVERVIVWSDGRKTSEDVDPFLKALGPGWTRASVQEHTVRDFWCWRSMFRCTRGVYVLSGEEPATDAAPPHGKKRGKSR
jgi:hypothetical protein